MAKVFIEETTLTAIGDAIRGKEGTTELIPVPDMATRISAIQGGGSGGGGELPVMEIDRVEYFNYNNSMTPVLEALKGKIFCARSNYIISNYFYGSNIACTDTSISLPKLYINCGLSAAPSLLNAFYYCKLGSLPELCFIDTANRTVGNFLNVFAYSSIVEPPKITFEGTGQKVKASTTGNLGSFFDSCTKLDKVTKEWWDKFDFSVINNYSHGLYNKLHYNNRALQEAYVPVVTKPTCTSNIFSSTFYHCNVIDDITFETNAGAPIAVSWKGQTFDVSQYIGYSNTANGTAYGYTNNVTDDATYAQYKDGKYWTNNISYSHYNHDSAVNTINSLPDTSAYLATTSGTNTIKFKGASGELTDGGAINTLTAEEIAVATAKGWTVTLS